MIPRIASAGLDRLLKNFPVVGLLGPRQCGKSTLARQLLQDWPESVYLDLERSSDLARLSDPETYLRAQRGKLVCLDEIQRKPDLFPLLRALTDEWGHPGCYLVLGSASRDLLRQSSESLAGRIVYNHLTPFLEAEWIPSGSHETYYARGGFPRSILAGDDGLSLEWRESFIATFLERDLLQWRNFTPALMGRLWQMLAHWNGQTMNYSALANALGITSATVKTYIDLLESTFMVVVLRPFSTNTGKRLVKAPKVYVADSGITNALLHLKNYGELVGHPVWGTVWEQIVLVNLKAHFPKADFAFYRTSHGAEVDIVMNLDGRKIAIECKATVAPALTRGNRQALEDLNPDAFYVVAPISAGWPLREGDVASLPELIGKIGRRF
jgi:hypothetical protein